MPFFSSVRIWHQNCCLHSTNDSPFQSGLGDKGDLRELIFLCSHSERPEMTVSRFCLGRALSPFVWFRMELYFSQISTARQTTHP